MGEGRPFSLFFPDVESGSCGVGLDGTGASLLGCGVRFDDSVGRVNVLIESVDTGVFFAGVETAGAGLGEPEGFFWKKPKIDCWFLLDCEPEAGCFF